MLRRAVPCAVLLAVGVGGGPRSLAGHVYWTNKGDDFPSICRGSMDGAQPYEVLLDADDELIEPRGLGVDLVGGKIYWTDAGTGKVQRADLDGAGVEDLVPPGNGFLADLELDLDAGKIYWTDVTNGAIRCADLDGKNVHNVATGLSSPYYLELDKQGGYVYWAEVDAGVIHRMNLDGSADTVIVSGLDRVRDVGLDVDRGMIYWNDRDTHKVQRAPLDEFQPIQDLYTFIPQEGKPHGMALDVAGGMIYWTDTRRGLKWIIRGSMDGSAAAEVLYTGQDDPWDIELAVPEPSSLTLAAVAGLAWVVVSLMPALSVLGGSSRSRVRPGSRWSHNAGGDAGVHKAKRR